MIVSFKCKETEKIWNEIVSKKIPADIQERALRKLSMLDVALALEDLRSLPGNHLEVLKGDRKGRLSIRINKQWRICFAWDEGNAIDVEVIDYH